MTTKKPYTPFIPYKFGDIKPISNEIYRPDNTNLNKLMDNIINTANPTEILNFFLTNPNNTYINENGDSPIHIIINIDNNKLDQDQKINIIKQLTKPPYNISLNVANNKLETPLHLATLKQYEKIIHFLIEEKVNVNAVNGKMQNALHIALIPSIKPCEKKITPDPIVPVTHEQDKNTMHNEILSVFHTNNNLINTDIIRKNATLIKDFEKHNMDSLYSIDENNKPFYKHNPIDTEISNMKNAISLHIVNKELDTNSIQKNISHELTKTITNISTEYENFFESSIKPIIANQKNIDEKLKITDDANLDILLGNDNKESIEKQINDENLRVYKEIYSQSNNIIGTLVTDYDPNNKKSMTFSYDKTSIDAYNAALSIMLPDIKELSSDIDEINNAIDGIMNARNKLIDNPNDNTNDAVNDVINAFTSKRNLKPELKTVADKFRRDGANPAIQYDATKIIYKMLGEQLPYVEGQRALGLSTTFLDRDDETIYDLILKLNVKYNNPYTKALKDIIEYVNNEFDEKTVDNQEDGNKFTNEPIFKEFKDNNEINENVKHTINIVHNFSAVPIIVAVLNGINKNNGVDSVVLNEINGAYDALEKIIKFVKYDDSGNYKYIVNEVKKIKNVPDSIIDLISKSTDKPFTLLKNIIFEISKIINKITHKSLRNKPMNYAAIYIIKVLSNYLFYNKSDPEKMYNIIKKALKIINDLNLDTFDKQFESVGIAKAADNTFYQIAVTGGQDLIESNDATNRITNSIIGEVNKMIVIPNIDKIQDTILSATSTAYATTSSLNNIPYMQDDSIRYTVDAISKAFENFPINDINKILNILNNPTIDIMPNYINLLNKLNQLVIVNNNIIYTNILNLMKKIINELKNKNIISNQPETKLSDINKNIGILYDDINNKIVPYIYDHFVYNNVALGIIPPNNINIRDARDDALIKIGLNPFGPIPIPARVDAGIFYAGPAVYATSTITSAFMTADIAIPNIKSTVDNIIHHTIISGLSNLPLAIPVLPAMPGEYLFHRTVATTTASIVAVVSDQININAILTIADVRNRNIINALIISQKEVETIVNEYNAIIAAGNLAGNLVAAQYNGAKKVVTDSLKIITAIISIPNLSKPDIIKNANSTYTNAKTAFKNAKLIKSVIDKLVSPPLPAGNIGNIRKDIIQKLKNAGNNNNIVSTIINDKIISVIQTSNTPNDIINNIKLAKLEAIYEIINSDKNISDIISDHVSKIYNIGKKNVNNAGVGVAVIAAKANVADNEANNVVNAIGNKIHEAIMNTISRYAIQIDNEIVDNDIVNAVSDTLKYAIQGLNAANNAFILTANQTRDAVIIPNISNIIINAAFMAAPIIPALPPPNKQDVINAINQSIPYAIIAEVARAAAQKIKYSNNVASAYSVAAIANGPYDNNLNNYVDSVNLAANNAAIALNSTAISVLNAVVGESHNRINANIIAAAVNNNELTTNIASIKIVLAIINNAPFRFINSIYDYTKYKIDLPLVAGGGLVIQQANAISIRNIINKINQHIILFAPVQPLVGGLYPPQSLARIAYDAYIFLNSTPTSVTHAVCIETARIIAMYAEKTARYIVQQGIQYLINNRIVFAGALVVPGPNPPIGASQNSLNNIRIVALQMIGIIPNDLILNAILKITNLAVSVCNNAILANNTPNAGYKHMNIAINEIKSIYDTALNLRNSQLFPANIDMVNNILDMTAFILSIVYASKYIYDATVNAALLTGATSVLVNDEVSLSTQRIYNVITRINNQANLIANVFVPAGNPQIPPYDVVYVIKSYGYNYGNIVIPRNYQDLLDTIDSAALTSTSINESKYKAAHAATKIITPGSKYAGIAVMVAAAAKVMFDNSNSTADDMKEAINNMNTIIKRASDTINPLVLGLGPGPRIINDVINEIINSTNMNEYIIESTGANNIGEAIGIIVSKAAELAKAPPDVISNIKIAITATYSEPSIQTIMNFTGVLGINTIDANNIIKFINKNKAQNNIPILAYNEIVRLNISNPMAITAIIAGVKEAKKDKVVATTRAAVAAIYNIIDMDIYNRVKLISDNAINKVIGAATQVVIVNPITNIDRIAIIDSKKQGEIIKLTNNSVTNIIDELYKFIPPNDDEKTKEVKDKLYEHSIALKASGLAVDAVLYATNPDSAPGYTGAKAINMAVLTNVYYTAAKTIENINNLNNKISIQKNIIDAVNDKTIKDAINTINTKSFRDNIKNIKKVAKEIITVANKAITNKVTINNLSDIMLKTLIATIEETNMKIATEKAYPNSILNPAAAAAIPAPNKIADTFQNLYINIKNVIGVINNIYLVMAVVFNDNNQANKQKVTDSINLLEQQLTGLDVILKEYPIDIRKDESDQILSITRSLHTLITDDSQSIPPPITKYTEYKNIIEATISEFNKVNPKISKTIVKEILKGIELRAEAALNTTTIPMLESVLKASKPYILQKMINDKKDAFDMLIVLKDAFDISIKFPTKPEYILNKIKEKISKDIESSIQKEINKNPTNSVAVVTSLLNIVKDYISKLLKLYPYDSKLQLFNYIIKFCSNNNNNVDGIIVDVNDKVDQNNQNILKDAINSAERTTMIADRVGDNTTYSDIVYAVYAGKTADKIAKIALDKNNTYTPRYVAIRTNNSKKLKILRGFNIINDRLTDVGIKAAKVAKATKIKGIEINLKLEVYTKLDEIKNIINISKVNCNIPLIIAACNAALTSLPDNDSNKVPLNKIIELLNNNNIIKAKLINFIGTNKILDNIILLLQNIDTIKDNPLAIVGINTIMKTNGGGNNPPFDIEVIRNTLANATVPIIIASFQYAINVGLYQKMNYNQDMIDDKCIKKDVIEYYVTLRNSLQILDNNKDNDRVKDINAIISQHVNSLNLLMSLNNIALNPEYNIIDVNNKIYKTNTILYAPNPPNPSNTNIRLGIFYLIPDDSLNYNILEDKDNKPISSNIENTQQKAKNIGEIGYIPNSFYGETIYIDFMNVLKRRFIKKWINKYKDAPIIKNIKKIITKNVKINNDNQTILTVITVLDNLIINILKGEIYLAAITKIKEIINKDDRTFGNYKNNIIQHLDKIYSPVNASLELDKQIDEMVLYGRNGRNGRNRQDDILDTDIINNIDNTNNKKYMIARKSDQGNYLVYYTKDYISIDINTIRQCMYNTTATVKELLSNMLPDYRKLDTNGFSPIHYAIHSSNYLLIEEMFKKIKNYSLHYVVDSSKITPISYAYNVIKDNSILPAFDNLNVSYINQLLLSAEINKNISTGYVDLYKILLGNINKFIIDDKYDFGGLLETTIDSKFVTIFKNKIKLGKDRRVFEEKDKLEIDITSINALETYVTKIEKSVMTNNKIDNEIIQINSQKASLTQLKNKLESLINIFELKYETNKLYEYNTSDRKDFKSSNKYYLLLISLGIISIYKLITKYYVKIISKKIYSTHAFTDVTSQPTVIIDRLTNVIKKFVKDNIFNLVRMFYNVRLDQYEAQLTESNVVGEFMNNLLNEFTKEGLMSSKSDVIIFDHVRQYINTYMVELIKQTLMYNNVILDTVHKWIVNLYYSIKTFDVLTNPN